MVAVERFDEPNGRRNLTRCGVDREEAIAGGDGATWVSTPGGGPQQGLVDGTVYPDECGCQGVRAIGERLIKRFGPLDTWPSNRRRVKDDAAGGDGPPPGVSEDEAIPDDHGQAPIEGDDRIAIVQEPEPGRDSGRPQVNVIGAAIRQFCCGPRRRNDPNQYPFACNSEIGAGQHRASGQIVAFYPGEVGGDPSARPDFRHRLLMRLQAADSDRTTRRQLEAIPGGNRPSDQGSGDDHARAGHHEAAVDPEHRAPHVRRRARRLQCSSQGRLQLRQAGAGDRRHLDDRPILGDRAVDVRLDIGASELDQIRLGKINPGQGDRTVLDVEQIEDGEMLFGLGHPSFVRGDGEQGDVDATDAGEHVLDEALVAGHVDETNHVPGADVGPGEPEIDGQAPLLLHGPTVRVSPGQGFDEGRLAVVDVTGRADDRHQMPASAAPTIESSSGRTLRRFTCTAPSRRDAITGGS